MQRDLSTETSSLPAESRETQIRSVVYEYLSRTNAGEVTTPDQYHAQYPGLMPELADALLLGAKNLRTLLDAERAMLAEGQEQSSVDAPTRLGPRIPNYTLLREIGSGGQGVVYEALQVSTRRRVAVKVLSAVSRNSFARFEREASAMAAFTHPGLVKIIDRGKTLDGLSFLVIEHVAGMSLDAWVAILNRSPHSIRQIVGIFQEIAAALGTAHDMGIVHRDLKPSNILIDEYNKPRIVDFGLALLVDWNDRTLTQKGNVIGSLPWCSPEQADSKPEDVTPASDIFSLGFMLYQALSGRTPYPVDGSMREIIHAICLSPAAKPDRLADAPFGRIDADISEILLTCLAKDPTQRPQSGKDLDQLLSAYLDGTYIRAKQPRRWRTAVAASMGCAIIAGIAWSQRPSWQSPSPLLVDLPRFQNSLGMELVQIPPGSFVMGSDSGEVGHQPDEQRHIVCLSHGFALGRTEVTQSQYVAVMGKLPDGSSYDASNAQLPVDCVSRLDAEEFCRRLSQREGRTYRLPTEAEWEYACRSGTSQSFAGSGEVNQIAWHRRNSGSHLHPVARLAPNQWGVYDMHGNAAEWVADEYIAYLGLNAVTDPTAVGANVNLGVQRGGDAAMDVERCRSAARQRQFSTAQTTYCGFRIACSAESNTSTK